MLLIEPVMHKYKIAVNDFMDDEGTTAYWRKKSKKKKKKKKNWVIHL